MSLPTPWLDRIFDKLTLTYGQQFLRRWQDVDLNAVKSDWAHELSGFQQHPRAIAWALQNLPVDHPPTVLEFRALARKAPAEDVPLIEVARASEATIKAEIEKMGAIRMAALQADRWAWARAIVDRNAATGKVTQTVLHIATEALKNDPKNRVAQEVSA